MNSARTVIDLRPKAMKPEAKARYIKLHSEVFDDTSACKKHACPGKCCGGCAAAEGYLHSSLDDAGVDELKKKYSFSQSHGFQTTQGCALPVEERSHICLNFYCFGTGSRPNQPYNAVREDFLHARPKLDEMGSMVFSKTRREEVYEVRL
jgi:hypothetical protein